MKLGPCVTSLAILCASSGCFASTEAAPSTSAVPSGDEQLSVSVSATLPTQRTEPCRALGVPITAFVTGVLPADSLISESATLLADSQCLHEQTLRAPIERWADVAYQALCLGGGEQLCGAPARRLCSADLLMQWAEPRSEPVTTQDQVQGFEYAVAPQDPRVRAALQQRALREARTLLDEIADVLAGQLAGTRDCPDEGSDELLTIYAQGVRMRAELERSVAVQGP